MKKMLFRKCLAIATAIAISMVPASFSSVSSLSLAEYTLSFDMDGATSEGAFDDIVTYGSYSVRLPEEELEKEGYYFSGWTANGYIMYEPNDVYQMPYEDTTLKPVWVDAEDETLRTITYDDQGYPSTTVFIPVKSLAGRSHSISAHFLEREGYSHLGWTDGVNTYEKYQKMIVPTNDVVLEPIWYKNYNIYYDAGDVDNIIGNSSFSFPRTVTMPFELADASRLSRKGYYISAWHCDFDDQIYSLATTYIMPDSEVHFTAVWEPLKYDIVFTTGGFSATKFTVPAVYGDSITVPECTTTKEGFAFGGWKYNNVVYKPGQTFEIPALTKGAGITFTAEWVDPSTIVEPEATVNSLTLVKTMQEYEAGNITAEEVKAQADFILNITE